MPAAVAAFFRQMNELELHKAITRVTCHVLASRSTSAKTEGKNTTSDKIISQRAFADAAIWPALSKGLVLRAFGIRGRRGRRPMICCLSFDMAKGKGRPNSRRWVPSILRTTKGKERPPRGSRCRFIKMVNHARP
jgi:hypothetical protein